MRTQTMVECRRGWCIETNVRRYGLSVADRAGPELVLIRPPGSLDQTRRVLPPLIEQPQRDLDKTPEGHSTSAVAY